MSASVKTTANPNTKIELSDVTQFVLNATKTLSDPSLDAIERLQLESIVFNCLASASEVSRRDYYVQYHRQRQALGERFPRAKSMLEAPRRIGSITFACRKLKQIEDVTGIDVATIFDMNEIEVGQRIGSRNVSELIFALSALNLVYQ